MGFPVGGMAPHGPVWLPVAVQRPTTKSPSPEYQVDVPIDVRKRPPEVERDLGLAGRAGFRRARAQVVADVLLVEDLVADVRVALAQTSS